MLLKVVAGNQKKIAHLANSIFDDLEENGLHSENANTLFKDIMTTVVGFLALVVGIAGISIAAPMGSGVAEKGGKEITAAEVSTQDEKPLLEKTIAIYVTAQGKYHINIDPTDYTVDEVLVRLRKIGGDLKQTGILLKKDFNTPSGFIDNFVARCFKEDLTIFIVPAEEK